MSEIPSPGKKLKSGGQAGHMDVIGLLEERIMELKTTLASAAARAAALETAAMVAMEKIDNNDHTEFLKGQLTHWQNREEKLRKKLRELQEKLEEELRKREGFAADSSGSFLEPLLIEDRKRPPPDYGALPNTLPFLSAPLPMHPSTYLEASVQCGHQPRLEKLAERLTKQAAITLADRVNACIPSNDGACEQLVVFDVWDLVLRPMILGLKGLADSYYSVYHKADMSARLRPDAMLFLLNVLVFKVEAKESEDDFFVAMSELHNKMAHWQAAYHGSREYILCCAIAGSKLQFYAVTCGGKRCKAISRVFCTNYVLDRLEIMHTALRCVNILLRQLDHQMPSKPLPLGRIMKSGTTSISYRSHSIEKSVDWPNFVNSEDRESIRKVYQHIMNLPNGAGLGHPRGILKPHTMPKEEGGSWRVEMPLGTQEIPCTEADLNSLVADVLHGLQALHAAGFVHRDVRRPNILQVKEGSGSPSYALIDFELSGLADEVPKFPALRHWPKECQKEGASYTRSADIHSLGWLMGEYGIDLSPSALRFSKMLQHDKPTAEEALRQLWTTP